MAKLTPDMKRVLDEQQLGFIATVTPDGKANLSPKGTTKAWDETHLIFGDIRSPATIRNLRANPSIEINVVDVSVRKGYRFKGTAEVIDDGAPRFEEMVRFFREGGSTSPFKHMVLMTVEHAAPLTSPSYDQGTTEADLAAKWDRYWDDLRRKRAAG
jgi:predicted pyridoxine 5'-phosphate oxidase superfamily flavin-nucleotide-binding protein